MSLLTFQQALTEAKASVTIDDFHNMFKRYEFAKELDGIKKGTNYITFDYKGKKVKITVAFGEIEVEVDRKVVRTIDVLNTVNQDDVDATIDTLTKLK